VRRYLRDPTFSRFDTIPECDGHTHTHTHTDTRRRHIPRLARRRAVIKPAKVGNSELSTILCITDLGISSFRHMLTIIVAKASLRAKLMYTVSQKTSHL